MKFKVVSNYNSDYNLYNLANDIWNIDNKYELTYGEDYDILIIFNNPLFLRKINVPKSNVFGFIQEPTWSGFYNKRLPEICNKVFYHDPSNFPQYDNVVKHNSIMFHHVWDKPKKGEIQFNKNNTKNLIENIPLKNKKLSIIVSNKEHDERYKHRQNFVKKLLESDIDFDMYGLDWDNLNDKRYKGYLHNKKDGLIDYEFSICIENCIEDSYITEKFFDAILCDTVPLYYGTKSVNRYYKNNIYEYIDVNSNEVINNIKNIIYNKTNKDYDLKLGKSLYTNNYNPFFVVKEYINDV